MRKQLLLPLLLVATSASAQSTQRFGIVDMQRVILSVSEGKAARAKLEQEIKAKEAELQKQKTELDKLNDDWKSQAAILSEEARMKKQQDFQQKFMGLRNAEMEFQGEIKKKESEATQAIAMRVAKMVEGLARNQRLAGVFETNSAGLLYLENPVDLTPEVIKSYDSQPRVATTAPAPAAASSPAPAPAPAK